EEKKDQGTGNKEQGTRRPPCVANARNTNEALEAQHVVATGVNRIARFEYEHDVALAREEAASRVDAEDGTLQFRRNELSVVVHVLVFVIDDAVVVVIVRVP
ncbi:MAG TPA: hypothetical protein VM223_01490, partial [Planctomycetota bacterium]|nr:hypothetical protein [Planctomycetota bacterium]